MKIVKRTGKVICCTLGILIMLAIIYFTYLLVSYSRIKDNVELEIYNNETAANPTAEVGATYSAISYNIGFGAYSNEYTFFMDGGEYSRAFSKESVLKNTKGDITLLKDNNPDIILLQEVDKNSTRSYHVNQQEMMTEELSQYASNYAINFNSAYLLYPFTEPHGASLSGMSTFSKFQLDTGLRRSLPISNGLYKFLDLDRCYTITRVKVNNGKELVIYNVHLSAYTDDANIVTSQIEMLSKDLMEDQKAGNYIICGGDFNQDLLGNSPEIFHTEEKAENWASPFPKDLLPDGITFGYQMLGEEEIKSIAPSCRNADIPYKQGESFVTMVDGFLVSDNIKVTAYRNIDNQFKYSDHNPVYMEFELKE